MGNKQAHLISNSSFLLLEDAAMRRSVTGFSLIELLIVIAIISILSAILFPVFARARAKARQTVCLSNQKQIGMAVVMYLQDYDERLFFYSSPYTPSESRTGAVIYEPMALHAARWWNELLPYTRNRQVLVCPDDDAPTLSEDERGTVDTRGRFTIPRSYIATRAVEGLALGQVDFPAEAIVITEKWGHFPNDASKLIGDAWIEPTVGDFNITPATGLMHLVANRHSGGVICVLFDGHAKWFRPQTIDDSVTLTGCDLNHEYPFVAQGLCDNTIAGCRATGSVNICNSFTYP